MYKIQTITAGSAVASLDFTVPSGYDDLYIVASVRDTTNSNALDHWIRFNNNTSNYTWRKLQGSGSAVNSASASVDPYLVFGVGPGASTTSNTFGNFAAYIPNYSASASKSVSVDAVGENNGTQAFQVISAGIWADTTAITSIQILPYSGGQFVQGSTGTLYGIRKYNTTATPKATGGIITYANGYWVHTFTASGTFTPTQSLSCDYLIAAGGGGGGLQYGGGGGAGGVVIGATSVTAQAYTITVGSGGAGASTQSGSQGGTGSNSSFNSITANGGGGGGGFSNAVNGTNGGSGGGASMGTTENSTGTAGTATQTSPSGGTGYGNAGGTGWYAAGGAQYKGGGGGGAGAVGQSAPQNTTVTGANGGDGIQSSITGTATYYGGGGGGHNYNATTRQSGGLGGGGFGSRNNEVATAGQLGTGGGGGGGGNNSIGGLGQAGGSGVVIIRYAA